MNQNDQIQMMRRALKAFLNYANIEKYVGTVICEMARSSLLVDQALAAQDEPESTVGDNSQNWAGMNGAIAWQLIERHADNWADISKMMNEWLKANQAAPTERAPILCIECGAQTHHLGNVCFGCRKKGGDGNVCQRSDGCNAGD